VVSSLKHGKKVGMDPAIVLATAVNGSLESRKQHISP